MGDARHLKEEIEGRARKLQSIAAVGVYFRFQILRLCARVLAIGLKVQKAPDDEENLHVLLWILRSLSEFIESLANTSGPTFYTRQNYIRMQLGIYFNRVNEVGRNLGILPPTDIAAKNLIAREDAEDSQKDEKTLISYIVANPRALRVEAQSYSRDTARDALQTLLARQNTARDLEKPILLDAIRILRGIVGSSPDFPLEHDFPGPEIPRPHRPSPGGTPGSREKSLPFPKQPSPAQAGHPPLSGGRPRHYSFGGLPPESRRTPSPGAARSPRLRGGTLFNGAHHKNVHVHWPDDPPNRTHENGQTPSPPSANPLRAYGSPPAHTPPLREGSGISIALRYQNAEGKTERYEPFGYSWAWSDPVVMTEATTVHDYLVQSGFNTRVLYPHRRWNIALEHSKNLGLINDSELQFLPARPNDLVHVLALFKIRGIMWVAGTTMGKPGLIPLECLGAENSTPPNDPKVISRPLHESARFFYGSRRIGVNLGRPIKGVISKKYLSYFDVGEEDGPLEFWHYLHDLKLHKAKKDLVRIQGVGTYYQVPAIVFVDQHGSGHEIYLEDSQKQLQCHDDIRRMQARGS